MPDENEPWDPSKEPRDPFPNDLGLLDLPLVLDLAELLRELEIEAWTAPGEPRRLERVFVVRESGAPLHYVPEF